MVENEKSAGSADDLFNNEGFIRDPQLWTEELARSIALQDGIAQLSEDHWVIIRALRNHYRRFGAPPAFHHLCLINHLDKHCAERLFRSQREAWRIAGLPDPGEEAKTYM